MCRAVVLTAGALLASTGAVLAVAPSANASTATPVCDPAQLTVTAEGGLAGLGHVGFRIHVVNATGSTCTVKGYPSVALLNGGGHSLQTATPTTRGYLGGLKTGGPKAPKFTLKAGGEATALAEGNDVVDPATCDTATAAQVTLPHATTSKKATIKKQTFFACPGVEIHPLLPGTTGSN